MKILLGHLGSFGDCLCATTVARQIKHDYPSCHLTWAIGSAFRSAIDLNPYVDDVWEIPASNLDAVMAVWPSFEREAEERKARGEFDKVFFTQILPANAGNYDGTVRSSIFRNYPGTITVPIAPVLRLSAGEVERVRTFAKAHCLKEKTAVILFECEPRSGQSSMTLGFALDVARRVVSSFPRACVILSSNLRFASDDERIVDGSVLSFRENAELTNYCSLLVGCSSGISWLCTSEAAKPLPSIQLIRTDAYCFASIVDDHRYFGLSCENIIELGEVNRAQLAACVLKALADGIPAAKALYHRRLRGTYRHFDDMELEYLRTGRIAESLRFLKFHLQRHGVRLRFLFWPVHRLLKKILSPVRTNGKSGVLVTESVEHRNEKP